jgi:ABC-type lipoprotein export system ATPase subunit
LLGANGSGKSRLLKALTDYPLIDGVTRETVYVEGGRALSTGPISRKGHSDTYNQNAKLVQRLSDMFHRIEKERSEAELRHKESLYNWDRAGAKTENKPAHPVSKFDRIHDAFSALFPHLELGTGEINLKNDPLPQVHWFCHSGKHIYNIEMLSDGEKQVLCLMCDVGELSPSKSLIIADEPELNLHPTLAMNLWNSIEQIRPEAIFVYATHSLSFAMRPSVTDVVILGSPFENPIHLTSPFDWSERELEPFLGAIPGVITSKRLLAVEGAGDSSFDRAFYQWLVGPHTKVASLGSCDDVRNAVLHDGIWGKAGDVKICGVVDRDYRTDARLDHVAQSGCVYLDYHEAESYLCHPQIIHDASQLSARDISVEEAIDALAKACQTQLFNTAVRRTVARTEIRLSIGPNPNSGPKDIDAGVSKVREWAESEMPRATNFADNAETAYRDEYRKCELAINNRDVDEMLRLFPGKELLKQLAPLAGFKVEKLLVSATRNLTPSNYPPLVKVIEVIRSKLE